MNPENQTSNQVSSNQPTNSDTTISLNPEQMITPEGSKAQSISYGEVMTDAWRMFTEKMWKLFSLLLVPYVVPAIAALIGFGLFSYINSNPELLRDIMLHTFTFGYPPVWLIATVGSLMLILGVVWFIIQSWSLAAMVHTTLSAEKIGVRQAYKDSKSYFWKFTVLMFVMGIITILYLPLLLLPALIVGIYFIVAMQVFVSEKVGVKESLLRSFEYVKGNFWKMFGLLATWTVIAMPVSAVFDSIVENSEVMGVVIFAAVIRFILSLVFTAFFMCIASVAYKALRAKKTILNVTAKFSYFVYPAIVGAILFIVMIWLAITNSPAIN